MADAQRMGNEAGKCRQLWQLPRKMHTDPHPGLIRACMAMNLAGDCKKKAGQSPASSNRTPFQASVKAVRLVSFLPRLGPHRCIHDAGAVFLVARSVRNPHAGVMSFFPKCQFRNENSRFCYVSEGAYKIRLHKLSHIRPVDGAVPWFGQDFAGGMGIAGGQEERNRPARGIVNSTLSRASGRGDRPWTRPRAFLM